MYGAELESFTSDQLMFSSTMRKTVFTSCCPGGASGSGGGGGCPGWHEGWQSSAGSPTAPTSKKSDELARSLRTRFHMTDLRFRAAYHEM